jgi:hypothetical protein
VWDRSPARLGRDEASGDPPEWGSGIRYSDMGMRPHGRGCATWRSEETPIRPRSQGVFEEFLSRLRCSALRSALLARAGDDVLLRLPSRTTLSPRSGYHRQVALDSGVPGGGILLMPESRVARGLCGESGGLEVLSVMGWRGRTFVRHRSGRLMAGLLVCIGFLVVVTPSASASSGNCAPTPNTDHC